MRPVYLAAATLLVAVGASADDAATDAAAAASAYDFAFHAQATSLYTTEGEPWNGPVFEEGQEVKLSDYAGHPILVVNTAAFCGFTPQFEGLQAVWDEYRDDGLVMIGVHADNFREQGGTEDELAEKCRSFGVDFPQMQAENVVGPETHPLYTWVRAQLPADQMRATLEAAPEPMRASISADLTDGITDEEVAEYGFPNWNFNKVLIGADGELLATFASGDFGNSSQVQPELIEAIEAALGRS